MDLNERKMNFWDLAGTFQAFQWKEYSGCVYTGGILYKNTFNTWGFHKPLPWEEYYE